MILIVFFAIWILPEGPEKTRPHIICLCISGIDVLVLVGGISNMNQQNNDQKTSGVHILLPI